MGFLSTLVLVVILAGAVGEQRDQRFDRSARDARTVIERRIASYGEVLYGARAAFQAPSFDRAAFHRFVEEADIVGRFPAIQAITFDRRIARNDLERFEARVRRDTSLDPEGYPSFKVRPRGTNDVLYAVEYVEPSAGNEAAFGFDIGSDPRRRAAVEEAQDTGDLTAASPITLVQDPGTDKGFILTLAVYERDSSPVTSAERRRNFIGVVVLAHGVDDMLRGVLSTNAGVRIDEMYDVGPTVSSEPGPVSVAGLLLDVDPRISALRPSTLPDPVRMLDLNVGSRRWRLVVVPAAAFAGTERFLPVLVGSMGALLTLVLAAAVLSFSRSRSRAVALAEDMTIDLVQKERDLQEANERLATSNDALAAKAKAMQEFVAVASHDMRSPLAAIMGFTRTLMNEWETTKDQDRREWLGVIDRRGGQLSRLVDDLLVSSEIDAGAVSARPGRIEVGGALEGICRDMVLKPGARVAVDADGGVLAIVDPDHLRRMVVNLVENAVNYGGGAVQVSARCRDGFAEITVKDEGAGIAADFVPRLFERFARATGSDHIRREGTGLGLSIVKGLANANAGEAWYEPNHPTGACFGIRLPRAD